MLSRLALHASAGGHDHHPLPALIHHRIGLVAISLGRNFTERDIDASPVVFS
jgi:hypothetical protein